MPKAKPVLIVSLLILSIAMGIIAYWYTRSMSLQTVTWGGPSLCVSEREFFRSSMEAFFDQWEPLTSRRRSPSPSEGHEQCLVIDLNRKLLWLTPREAGVATDYVQLPAGLMWKLYACSGNRVDQVPPLACLRPAQRWHGTLALAGYSAEGAQFSCALHGPYLNGNMRWGPHQFDPNTLGRSGPREGFSSILITNQRRLEPFVRTCPVLDSPAGMPAPEEGGSGLLQRNRAIWQLLQKPLYQALEQQATRRGYEVARILVRPGPDYTAGLAGIGMKPPGKKRGNRFWSFLQRFRRRISVPYLLFTVDAQTDGRWRCQTAQRPGASGVSKIRDEFAFTIEQPECKAQVTVPRARPELDALPWSVTLEDGTLVELVAACRNPGLTWWAPDGSTLDYWPGFLGQERVGRMMSELSASRSGWQGPVRQRLSDQDEGDVIVLLRVPSLTALGTGSSRSSSRSSSVSTTVFFGRQSPLLDRFGWSHSPGQYILLKFDAQDQDRISHALGIQVGDAQSRPGIFRPGRPRPRGLGRINRSTPTGGSPRQIPPGNRDQPETDSGPPLQWIQLKNISLGPGQATAFEMVVADDPGDIESTSQVQVRP